MARRSMAKLIATSKECLRPSPARACVEVSRQGWSAASGVGCFSAARGLWLRSRVSFLKLFVDLLEGDGRHIQDEWVYELQLIN